MPDIILDLGDDIKGESSVTNFEDKILCNSFSFGANQPIDVSRNKGRTTGTVNVSQIHLTRDYDSASLLILNALFLGKSFESAKLHFLYAAGDAEEAQVELMTVTLTNAMIADYQIGAATGGGSMSEQITIGFTAIDCAYATQEETGEKGQGNITASYNLLTGAAAESAA
jgi:type VI secretion system secreted protein Hcp